MISPVMAELSAYIAGAVRKPLPVEVVERAKIHLVDTVAAMISGSRLLPGREALKYISAQGGRKEACVMGTRLVTSAPNAAFANGMFAHADETDDTHPPSRSQRSHRDDITGDNTAAIASGLQRTSGVITSAALLLVIVIGAFSVSSITRFLSPGASRG